MPRKPEPSFDLKRIIWDVAATVGKDKPAQIERQLDRELEKRRKAGDFFENTPDSRTTKRIINEDINELPLEVVIAKLPDYVWRLRKDYEAVRQLAKSKPREEQHNWIEDHFATHGVYPPLPKPLDLLVLNYVAGQPLRKDMVIVRANMQIWRQIKNVPSRYKKARELLEWLGIDFDEYEYELFVRAAPGGPGPIQITYR